MAYVKTLGVLVVLGATIGTMVAVVGNLFFEDTSINFALVTGVIVGITVGSLSGPLERRFRRRDRHSTSGDQAGGS